MQISVKELYLIFYIKVVIIIAKVTSIVAFFVINIYRASLIAAIVNLDIKPLILVQ